MTEAKLKITNPKLSESVERIGEVIFEQEKAKFKSLGDALKGMEAEIAKLPAGAEDEINVARLSPAEMDRLWAPDKEKPENGPR